MSTDVSTICVVEDDLDVCDSLEAVVTSLGHRCNTFDSAEALLLHWERSACSLLVIDIDLPEMSGIELLTTLRSQGDQTPAIFYTGRSDARVRTAAETLGDVLLIEKGNEENRIEDYLRNLITDKNA